MSQLRVTLEADTTEMERVLTELSALLTDASDELCDAVLRRANDLICIDNNVAPAAGTDKLIVSFRPSDLHLGLVSALRAGDFQGALQHLQSPSVEASADGTGLPGDDKPSGRPNCDGRRPQ